MNKYIHTTLKGTLTAIMLMVGISAWAQEPEPTKVAQIDEEHKFETLQAAIDAATADQTITLIAESGITESVTNTNTNSFTINLNGKTWNGDEETAALTQNATSGTISITGTSGSMGAIICNAGASLSISGGTFTGTITNTNGMITISGGTFSGTITNNENGKITITGGTFSTRPEAGWIAQGYVVKTNTGESTTTYTVEPIVKVVANLPGEATTEQTAAANALAGNTSVSETTGLGDNGSLDVSITGVNLDANNNVTSATFEVTPKDANGNTITVFSGTYTFRLPISSSVAEGKWVNLKHNETYIPASKVAKEGGNKYVTVTTTSFSPFSYDVLENPVAKIGKQLYETVAAAISDAAETETTIELIANATENIAIPAGKNINFVGGEYKLTGTITNNGTLKITSGVFTANPEAEWIATGSEVMVGESNTYVVAATGTAEAQIVVDEHPTLYQTIALAITAAGTEAATITLLKDIAAETIAIPENANITLELGKVTLTKAITNSGTLNISGGTISGNITNEGTLTITSSTISGAITNTGTLTITSGTISGNITNAESATLTINDGTFTGTITNNGTLNITGGTFYIKPSSYTCETGHELVVNNEGHYVVVLTSETEAQIGSEKYLTIGKAIEVAGSTETSITLLKDPTSTPTIEIPAGATITLAISNGLSKPIANNGALTIESGSTTGNLTIMIATATIIIKEAVTHNGVQLDGSLGDYVLKTIDGTSLKTYRAEKRFSIQVGGIAEGPQRTAAEAMTHNDALSTITGLGENQSIAVTITSVTLTGDNATSATFNVELSGANGEQITTATNDITFRLPVSTGIQDGKWVNVKNATEAISGGTVNVGHFVEITTKNFPTFSYTILATEPVAQIGKTKYVSVAAAIAEANEQTIEILKNIDEVITVADSKIITLEGEECKLSGTITNNGALTLASGTYSGAITSTAGTITINGGSFSSSLTTDGGTITITNGTFASTCVFTETNGDIAISGGTFDNIPDVDLCATGYVPVKNAAGKFNMTNDWKMDDATLIESISYYGSHNYTVATATYTRNVGMVGVGGNPAGTKYGTICLPFNITVAPTDETKLYKAKSVSATELTIEEVTIDAEHPILAGTPLIFELSADAAITMKIVSTNAIINVAAPAATPADNNLLVGTYSETTISGDALTNTYYLNGDKFHQAVNSLKVPAYRAYIHYEAPTPDPAPRFLNIHKGGEDDNEATGIQQTAALEGVTEVYDLNGRKLSGLQRGVNIMRRADGSTIKVIVK